MKISIIGLITEEQLAVFDSKLEDMKSSKKHFGKHAKNSERFKASKIDALEITDDQLEQLALLLTTFKSNLETFNNQFMAGEIETDNFIDATTELLQNKQSERAEILTDKQKTIIKIHHALTVIAHRKYKYSDKG